MPTYVSKCGACGQEHEFVTRIANRDETPVCCGEPTTRILVTPMIAATLFSGHAGFLMEDGKNDGKGTWIETSQDYHRYLKDNNKIPVSEGKREAEIKAERRKKEEDRKLTAAVEKAVLSNPKT